MILVMFGQHKIVDSRRGGLMTVWLVLVTIVLAGWGNTAWASEKIDQFAVDIQIKKDGRIEVAEDIVYDFGNSKRHGIYREIPYKYKARGGNYSLDITNISVINKAGFVYQTQISREGGNLKIRIGNPDKYVTGRQVYIIKYSVAGAINFFDDHDELYWNVTGEKWKVPMQGILADIIFPEKIGREGVKMDCWAGTVGSQNPCDDSLYMEDKNGTSEALFTQDSLGPGQGATVVVGMPKGIIEEPTWLEKMQKIVADNWVLSWPIITLLVLYYLWRSKGKDPQGRGAIVPQYDPPEGLSPSQVGTILDERVDQVDMSADIVHLAVNGYLKIRRIEQRKLLGKKIDYELRKLKEVTDDLSKPERELLKKLFDGKKQVKLSDLKNEFYKDWAKIRKKVYQSVVEMGYFPKNPARVRIAYTVIGIVLFGIIGGLVASYLIGPIGAFSLVVSGIMVAGFGIIMPVKTKKGVLMREYILGLKRYISIAEKARIEFHNAPEKSPELFDRLLPFTMVLKVEKQWAKQFKELYNQPPSWYEGPAGTRFNAAVLATDMNRFSATAGSSLASRPSSAAGGGSGFSGGGAGGGFGGGGGGSW